MNRLNNESAKIVTNYVIGSTRNILLGGSLSYAIEKENYYHIPLIVFFPSVYTGYQAYKNKNDIVKWLQDSF